jgi:circadian clock protein KaiC
MDSSNNTTSNERCISGVEGLDIVLAGGLPKNRLYLLKGDPGVGKTTLAMQFLLEGIKNGETGLYITLSETKDEIMVVAESHGWDLTGIHLFELSMIEEKIWNETESTFFHPSEIELNRTVSALTDEVIRVNPARVVFDSLSELRMLADTPLRYRRQILHLKQFFAGRACTCLVLDDRSSNSSDLQVESIAHGVLSLTCSPSGYGVAQRQLRVIKIRGSKFMEGTHDLILKRGGVEIFPRLVMTESLPEFVREDFSSGISQLDLLLGGGLGRGTSSIFMGPPGTGKSTLTLLFALQAAEKGEKVLIYVFDETLGTLLDRAAALNMDLRPMVEKGMILIQTVDPAEISPGELAHRARQAVNHDGVGMIIIDSINGYLNAMPVERYLVLQLHELLGYLNQRGVISILVLAQQGFIGQMHASVDLTYLADTVLLLRFYESRGEVRQAISVIKKRSGDHERTIRRLSINKHGITVGEPLHEFQGVLTGVPTLLETPSVR